MRRLFLIIILLLAFLSIRIFVRADLTDQINQVQGQIDSLNSQLKSKESNYTGLTKKLQDIKSQLAYLEQEIKRKAVEVAQGEKTLEYQKSLLNERTRSYYKNIGKNSLSLVNLLVAENLGKSLNNFFYQKSLVDEDKNTIIKIIFYIKGLEEKKASLQQNQTQLSLLKLEVDKQSQALAGEIVETKQKIAQLSALQQQLVAQKLASLNISRSAASLGRCDSDLTNGRDPGFSPRLAVFTYGVPNRVGLNQWGAYGRAKEGQGYDQILRAYYSFDGYQDFDVNTKINVDGYGSYSLEDYVKRIYEVPGDWPADVLRAQAIAARSYALAYTNNGQGSICASENCQVFKSDPKGGAWEQAVNDTSGKVMTQGGKPIKAWFSSTHGGYVRSSGEIGWSDTSWTKHAIDTSSGNAASFGDLQGAAYDRDSPWFYCDWGSRSEYNKTAWLKPEELADIINSISLAKRDSSVQEHLYQTDRSNPAGTDTWDAGRVKDELRQRGGNPYNNVSDVSVSVDFSAGRVTSVSVSGDAGTTSFDGAEFKNFFNLRAPSNIQIVGPLFAFEKR